jgi:hypothetical protein
MKNTNLKNFLIAIFVLLAVLFIARLVSGEDRWICKDGQWARHGVPSSKMPVGECK